MPDGPQAPGHAIWELIELCRSGDFYVDHDEGLAVLGRAEAEVVRLHGGRPTWP